MDLNQLRSDIYTSLSLGEFYSALEVIKGYVKKAGDRNDTLYKIEQLEAEAEMSCQWWKEGQDVPDDNMLDTYFIPALSRLWDNYMLLDWMTANNSYLLIQRDRVRGSGRDWSWSEIRKRLESFVSNIAVMQLQSGIDGNMEAKLEMIYDEQKKYRQQLFVYVLTELRLKDSDLQELEELLQTPTVDNIDQRMIISAMTLNGLVAVDPVKLKLMLNVYRGSLDVAVRQYALVGLMLMMPGCNYPMTDDVAEQVADLVNTDDELRESITQMQMQLSYCESAEKDSRAFQESVMPEIIKASNFKMTKNGLEMVDDDPMDDILGRSNTEKRMEELEARMHSFIDKRKQGVDIFFQGFKHMKHYSFFIDLSNWLVPFYAEHPDIREAMRRIGSGNALSNMILTAPICDNDKYSLIFAFAGMMDKMPKEMLDQCQVAMGDDSLHGSWTDDPAALRRNYLQSLYRFFELFPYRSSFVNPFSPKNSILRNGEPQKVSLVAANDVFNDTRFKENMLDLIKYYMRNNDDEAVGCLIKSFMLDFGDNFDISYVKALYFSKHNVKLAGIFFRQCLRLRPDSVQPKYRYARMLFEEEKYEDARELYRQLMEAQEQNGKWMLGYAVCCINLSEYDEALKILFRLNYEHPGDNNVTRTLAKALLMDGRVAEAEKYMGNIVGEKTNEDWIIVGLSLWAQKRREEAADCFSNINFNMGEEPDYTAFVSDFTKQTDDLWDSMDRWLSSSDEIKIMEHNVWKRIKK